jgi:integrase
VKAYIRKRGDRWLLTKELGRDERAKRIRRFESFATKAEAEAARDLFLGAFAAGAVVDEARITVHSYFVEGWLPDVKRRVSPSTFENYERMVRVHIVPALGFRQLAKVTPLQLERFVAGVELAPASVVKLVQIVRQAFERAVEWELIKRNPTAKLKAPHVPRPEQVRALTDQEKQRLLEATKGTSIHGIVLLALATGMRRGEILALRWSDVDLAAGTITVARSVQETKAGCSAGPPKTGRTRVIRVPASTIAHLRQHKAMQNETRLFLSATWQDEDLVFPRPTGGLRRPTEVSRAFDRICAPPEAPSERPAGVKVWPKTRPRIGLDASFHDLRHTHATDLLRAGVPVKVVSERLGHASVSTTLDVYAHVLPDMQDAAAAAADAILERVTPETS